MTQRSSTQMTLKQIEELLKLKGWTQAQLARELDLSEAAVSRWFGGKQGPTGPTRILLKQWLDQAREEAKKQPA